MAFLPTFVEVCPKLYKLNRSRLTAWGANHLDHLSLEILLTTLEFGSFPTHPAQEWGGNLLTSPPSWYLIAKDTPPLCNKSVSSCSPYTLLLQVPFPSRPLFHLRNPCFPVRRCALENTRWPLRRTVRRVCQVRLERRVVATAWSLFTIQTKGKHASIHKLQ